ncbi:MAG: DUF6429 family protein [Salinibacter sp.]|uniref:DUF6429 family protein n=1 Tax=Salinibacter sp. TaxID=2065818 RepID=UPI0035D4FA87
MDYDEDKVDETILALLWLTAWETDVSVDDRPVMRTWKGHNFKHMNRLHDKGYIADPRSKAESVVLTEKGRERAEELFQELFGVEDPLDES